MILINVFSGQTGRKKKKEKERGIKIFTIISIVTLTFTILDKFKMNIDCERFLLLDFHS